MPVRSRSLVFGTLEIALVLSIAAGVAIVAASDDDAHGVIARERAAIAVIDRVAAAERAFRASRVRDSDADGRPEYGRLSDLDPSVGARSADAQGEHLLIDGYRVEVLLPKAVERVDRSDRRVWVRSTERHDVDLAAQSFAVVALPLRDGSRVLRGFYLDGDGYGYVAEGVYAADRDPVVAPPRIEMRKQKETGGVEDGRAWRSWRRPAGAPPLR